MFRYTALALAGAAALAAGAAMPLSTARAGVTGYAHAPYKHHHVYHHRYNGPGIHCRWVSYPVKVRAWHPWRGWVWHTTWRSKRVCY